MACAGYVLHLISEGVAMSFVQSVKRCFINYKNFSGRASRSDYWFFYLFDIIIFNLISIIQGSLNQVDSVFSALDIIIMIFGIGLGITYLAVSVRRLHDVNRSGWWLLIAFTVIGILWLLYWFTKSGDPEANRFGDEPIT